MSWLTGPMPWILDIRWMISQLHVPAIRKKRVFLVEFVTYLCLPKFPAPGCRSSFWLKSVSDVDRIFFHVEKKSDDDRHAFEGNEIIVPFMQDQHGHDDSEESLVHYWTSSMLKNKPIPVGWHPACITFSWCGGQPLYTKTSPKHLLDSYNMFSIFFWKLRCIKYGSPNFAFVPLKRAYYWLRHIFSPVFGLCRGVPRKSP